MKQVISDLLRGMLDACDSNQPVCPPTLLYNEGWLLRLVLNWSSTHTMPGHPLCSPSGTRWFTEALLPPAFPREQWTHADGVIGHFAIGKEHKADLTLQPDATHFVVLEAKMFSGLSAGIRNVRDYDQAARSVACIAETLRRASVPPSNLSRPGFYVVAPRSQISAGVFSQVDRRAILEKVRRRAESCGRNATAWFDDWFVPTLKRIDLGCLSWEDLLAVVEQHDTESHARLVAFYEQCIRFNRR